MGCPSGGGGCGPRDANELMEMVREQRKQRRIDRIVSILASSPPIGTRDSIENRVTWALAVLEEIERRVP